MNCSSESEVLPQHVRAAGDSLTFARVGVIRARQEASEDLRRKLQVKATKAWRD
jgi:hypothetical protein